MNWWVINVETCLNHFINVYLCLYVDGVWIGMIVVMFEWNMRKLWVLVKNKLGDEFEVNWGFDLMFIVVFIAFFVILCIVV